jgi:glycolate oxidase
MESKLIDALIKIVGNAGVLHTPEDLAVYSYDGTFAEGQPDVIVLPETTEQVSQIVKLAAEHCVPLVPRGMGSGLAAGSIPMPSGGIVLCLTRMNHILEIDTESRATPAGRAV